MAESTRFLDGYDWIDEYLKALSDLYARYGYTFHLPITTLEDLIIGSLTTSLRLGDIKEEDDTEDALIAISQSVMDHLSAGPESGHPLYTMTYYIIYDAAQVIIEGMGEGLTIKI